MQEHREDDQNDSTNFDPALNYVDILGVSNDADDTEIKRRYGSRLRNSKSTFRCQAKYCISSSGLVLVQWESLRTCTSVPRPSYHTTRLVPPGTRNRVISIFLGLYCVISQKANISQVSSIFTSIGRAPHFNGGGVSR